MTNIVTLGLGSTPSGVILLGYHWGGVTPPVEEDSVSGGWLSPEQARAVLRKIHRRRSEKARRAEELQAAIEEAERAEESGSPDPAAPIRQIIERDTGTLVPMLGTLQDALNQLAWMDQQVAALNQRRMDDAVAVLLLTEV
jgi:hypothetical protein